MRTNLTKETIFTLYKCKEAFKNSNKEMYEEFLNMFDEDLKRLFIKRNANDWNYLLLILFFKYGKLTAKGIFKMIYPNETSHRFNAEYNECSNRLTALFKEKICYRISHLSEENRQYYEYHLNWENKDFDTSKITDKIAKFIEENEVFSYEKLEDYVYPNKLDILTPDNIKSRLKAQFFNVIKYRKIPLYFFPSKKNNLDRIYYTNKDIDKDVLEKYFIGYRLLKHNYL